MTSLQLNVNQVVDTSPLLGLSNLLYLDLGHNQIVDIKPLATLSSLIYLNLQGNPIKQKICPLEPMAICTF